jgi:hypothetical protein
VQCLYCEAPLKNFRGLFDEDFCSREHRDKYSASFRKALTQLPETESPVAPSPLFPEALPPAISSQETVQSVVPQAPRAPEVQTVTVSYVAPEAAIEASQPPPSVEADFLKTPLVASCSFSPGSMSDAAFALWNAIKPVVPFSPEAAETRLLPIAGTIDPTLYALQLVSAPASAVEFPLAHEGFLPTFTPSRAAMSADEQTESEPHEMAPALVMNAGPVTSTFSSPARSPEMMPPSFGIQSARPVAAPAQFNVPGLSLNASTQPDTIADISMPHQKAANPAAQPHSHEPLRPTFGSSVRIKNWRLRINFAKPA